MKTVYLVRHGEAGEDRLHEVTYTPINKYDQPLTKQGVAQAARLKEVFSGIPIDRVFTSDYLRAMETFEQLGKAPCHHEALSEIREIFCEFIGKNLGNTDSGEFLRQKDRVEKFIDNQIRTINDGETIMVVAHGCFILYLLEKLTGKSFGHDMTHTGITKLVFEENWDFEFFNSSSHLYERIAPEIKRFT
ncbi:MAG: histidine phosphatase family protein [Pseudomonadota bacterium]